MKRPPVLSFDIDRPTPAVREFSWAPIRALAGSLPRAATDDESVEVWERLFDAPSPEDAILDMIDAKRRAARKARR